MNVQVTNNGLYVRIAINGRPIMLSKFQMPPMEPVGIDRVRFAIGKDCLSDLYINVNDIAATPKFKDADSLITLIASFLLAGPATNI